MSTVSSTAAYVQDDGSESPSRSDSIGISDSALSTLWQAYSSSIPVGYARGVATRESGTNDDGNFVSNEHDTDTQDDGSTRETYGIFQMNLTEAAFALIIPPTPSALIDPENNIKCAAVNFQAHLDAIADASGTDTTNSDVWCYLAWAHNNGIGAVLTSILKYGLDWTALKARPQNDYMTSKLIPYAEAVQTATLADMTLGTGVSNNWGSESLIVLLFAGVALYAIFG
jgi:hypothetical protein